MPHCHHQSVTGDVSETGQVTITQRSASGERLNIVVMHVDQLSALSAWAQSKAARRDGAGAKTVTVTVCTRNEGESALGGGS